MVDFSPVLWLYARWRAARLRALDPAAAQERELRRLLSRASGTVFGRQHDFGRIRTIGDFQRAVPLRSYEEFWDGWWRDAFPVHENLTSPGRTPYFAVTSGTTSGTTKYIPITDAMVASNKKAAVDVVVHHMARHPGSRPLKGKTFMMGGSTDLVEEAPGVFSGDLSGIAVRTQSAWTRPFAWPPEETALLDDWEEKLTRFVHDGFEQNISIWTGVPSWMLFLLERMREEAPDRPPFPNLDLLVHGGVSWDLYRDRFRDFLHATGASTREVYPASEGFIAVQDRGEGEGLALIPDNGIFFEFVPVEELGADTPTRHWAGNLETGVNYAIAVTTCAGLYAYLIGDTVRFVDRERPRLLITGRTSYMLSAFGEHLIGSEIEQAVHEAAEMQAVDVIEFIVGPVLTGDSGGRGGHVYLLEAAGDVDTSRLAADIDTLLSATNDDYRAHRGGGHGMDAPEVRLQPHGAFERWMEMKGKSGGQHKVPRVIAEAQKFTEVLEEFEEIAGGG